MSDVNGLKGTLAKKRAIDAHIRSFPDRREHRNNQTHHCSPNQTDFRGGGGGGVYFPFN